MLGKVAYVGSKVEIGLVFFFRGTIRDDVFFLLPRELNQKTGNHQKNGCLIDAEIDKWVIKLETGTKFAGAKSRSQALLSFPKKNR